MIKLETTDEGPGLYGVVGKDAETRKFSQSEVVTFSVASNRGKGDKRRTTWVRCTVWEENRRDEAIKIRKGDRLIVRGLLELRQYTKADGTPGSTLDLSVTSWGPQTPWGDREKPVEQPRPKLNEPVAGYDQEKPDEIPF